MKNIAINGFGRIGRLAFRELLSNKDINIVAINDLTDPKTLAHLLKYDTAHGGITKCWEVSVDGDSIVLINKCTSEKRSFKVISERDPKALPWASLNVDCVLECTGRFTDKDAAMAHIEAGAKKVVISAPAKGDLKTIVYNVNHQVLSGDDKVISAASCTTNALAPVVNAVHKKFGVASGFMTTIHAYTADQRLQDSPHSDLRRARAAGFSIIPTSTGAAAAIGKVIPELLGKMDGVAHRVPTITGSLVDMTLKLEKPATAEEINKAVEEAASETLCYCTDPIVSADIISHTAGSIFDSLLTKVLPTGEVKLYTWYDNESSYVNQLVRTLTHFVTL
ncbi:type I glyceraldehyde-3-phosphate dehydrogenase [Candidatus Mycoplasma haematobovis]|uniref:Glyceraldehyde-3-phosphate dehydrogenase n=1 Tax=Candidatus Mycoplasma haematobovis TaxID=432608 RepID=A0A1A9QE14_9MOLU|nr:type I glyceraldehyde-3-phosphate dehydrogenase [Candidatus Mycoplasma haematobovis]OAL10717.1 type I glyceraldehyde-3-phosphate dehydrogenase [Candidatus Mycoplasma haematobovis]